MHSPVALLSPQRTLLEHRLRQKDPITAVIRPGPRGSDPRMLSFGQERMWFLWRLEPETPVYNGSLRLRLRGPLNVPALERAINEIWRRHDVLRAHFPSPEGQPMQVVRPWEPESLPLVSLEHFDPSARELELENLTRRVVLEPYDLEAGPVTRRSLARVSPEEHVLILAFHHIVFDAWSRQVAQRELEQLYTAFAQGKVSPLPELPIQYADFARWQREQSETPRYRDALDHWLQHLAGKLPVLSLPIARPRPVQRTYQGAEVQMPLPAELINSLNALAQHEGATLFVVLLVAYKTLLHRYTGLEDLIVGSPVAGRTVVETESLMGCLVNTLAIRSRVESSMPFRSLLRAEREAVLAAFENQIASFEQVVERVSAERAPNRTPIFQAVLNLKNVPQACSRWENLEVTRWDFEAGIAQFDLAIGLEEKGGGLDAVCRFSTELFDRACMQRFMSHWRVLLEGIAKRPDAKLFELPLLTEAERHQLLIEWNQTARPYPRERGAHELFEEQAHKRPDASAVCFHDQSWSYRELDHCSEKIAAHLQTLGIAPDQLVGLCVERSPEMVAALLGILKSGGAYLPLDSALPDERLVVQLTDARPTVLIAQCSNLERFRLLAKQIGIGDRKTACSVISIEELIASPSPVHRTRPVVQAEHLAYVMYTSGSTGRPKGVMIPHRGIVRLVKNCDYASLSAEETFLHLAPLSFDASTFEIWGALLNGGRLALMPPGPPTPSDIGEAIRRHGVTTLWLTASLFHLMAEERLADLQPLRQLLTGGDLLSPRHVARVLRRLPGCKLINGYGPTENTTFTCCHAISRDEDGSRPISIGRPIANTRVYALDRHLQPVPVGVPGELCAAGDGVARGYLTDPTGTAERFVSDPFSTAPGTRMYRTGDLVSYNADGTLNFLGRLDRQVKIRGFRVELEEIEAALLDCPGIKEAAVVVRDVADGDRQLVGYVVAESATERATENWRAHLSKRLPDYMLPVAWVKLDRFPLSPNGKIDRAALPPSVVAEKCSPEVTADPLNLLEFELLRIWQRLFGRSDIGRRDNFFDLGGHSLMAARLATQVERLLGHRMPLASIFQAPTVESLTRMLRDADWLPAWTSLVPLQPHGAKPSLFFVHGWGGDVFTFVNLARMLGPDQPVYGLQAVGLDGRQPRHTSVEAMARHYVEEIRSFQPNGPYYLCAYSLGGWIAWEIAQQLHLAGQRIGLLALLDTHATCRLPFVLQVRMLGSRLLVRFGFHVRRLFTLPPREWPGYAAGRFAALRFLLWRTRPPAPSSAADSADPAFPGTAHAGDHYCELTFRYRPSCYAGAVDWFCSEHSSPKALIALKRLARAGVRQHLVAGDHHTLLDEEHVNGFAATFRQALLNAQEQARRPSE